MALALYLVATLGLVASMIVLPRFLAPRHAGRATVQPYEGGMLPTGTARTRVSVPFFRIAVFFVLFDLEAVFITAWAVSARETGWWGYAGFGVFLALLLAALGYLIQSGGLDVRRR